MWNMLAAKIIQWTIFFFWCASLVGTSMCETNPQISPCFGVVEEMKLDGGTGDATEFQEGSSKFQTARLFQTRLQTGLTRNQRLSLNKPRPGVQQSQIIMAFMNQRGSGQSDDLSGLLCLFQMDKHVLSYSQ